MTEAEAWEYQKPHFAKVFTSEDAKEGPRAFAEKRGSRVEREVSDGHRLQPRRPSSRRSGVAPGPFVEDVIKPTEERIDDEQLRDSDRKAYFGELLGMRQKAAGGRPLAAAHARPSGAAWASATCSWRWSRPRRRSAARAVRAQLPGARRGQHAHAAALGHRRAEGEVPPPAVRGHGVLVLRDDRARGRRLRPDADPDAAPCRTATTG